jgi:hypothetical protein
MVSELTDLMRTLVLAPAFGSDGVFNFLRQQLDVVRYALAPIKWNRLQSDRRYSANEEFWGALQHPADPIRANTVVHLHKFALTEWLPRTPGVYHTAHARRERRTAQGFRISEDDFLQRASQHRRRPGTSWNDHGRPNPASVIYDPYGKSKMIEGGIGCVRLKEIDLAQGRTWFLGATSSEAVHEGIPIALNDERYKEYISDIARGGFVCDLVARSRFMPSSLERMYRNAVHIPQMYLEVEQLRPIRTRSLDVRKGDWVTGAVGFRATEGERARLLATYTSFKNGSPSSLREAVEWLDEVYVKNVFHGTVVTDFDQQSTRFAGAVFSLDSLLANAVDIETAREIVISVADPKVSAKLIERMSRSAIRMEANVKNTVKFGDGATLHNVNLNQAHTIAIGSQIGPLSDQLQKAIESCSAKVSERRATQLEKDGAALRKKLATSKLDKRGITKLLSSIESTAKAVGKAGRPILKIAGMLAAAIQG